MRKLTAMILVLGGLAGLASAEPFQMAGVATDAKWIVHADIDDLKQTQVGRHILDEMNRDASAAKLDALEAVFNFDPREDLRAVTLYGSDARPDRSVAIIRGTMDTERLVTLVRANDSYQVDDQGPRPIHSWIDEQKPASPRVHGGFLGGGILVMSESPAMVRSALDVLDGRSGGMTASHELASAIGRADTAFFMAAANLSDMPAAVPEAAILQKARAFHLAVDEVGTDMQIMLRMVTETPRDAELLENMLRGMIAFGQLNEAGEPELAAIAGKARVTRDERVIEIALSHPGDKIVEMIKKDAERKRQAAAP